MPIGMQLIIDHSTWLCILTLAERKYKARWSGDPMKEDLPSQQPRRYRIIVIVVDREVFKLALQILPMVTGTLTAFTAAMAAVIQLVHITVG